VTTVTAATGLSGHSPSIDGRYDRHSKREHAMNTEIRELDVAELDQVSGGFFYAMFVRFIPKVETGGGGGGDQGGQNDPAQMFQQIMQQLTQGQG
jgi:hypothetical protein